MQHHTKHSHGSPHTRSTDAQRRSQRTTIGDSHSPHSTGRTRPSSTTDYLNSNAYIDPATMQYLTAAADKLHNARLTFRQCDPSTHPVATLCYLFMGGVTNAQLNQLIDRRSPLIPGIP